jgi:hypothetical protein
VLVVLCTLTGFCLLTSVVSPQAKRAEFWDTQPSYGGSPEIWAALHAACEAPDMRGLMLFLEAADIKVAKPDFTAFFDVRGFLYEVPEWAVADPADWKHK